MLSILIVNWNTRDLLRACLASISRYPPSEPYEVVVVDNASADSSAEMVRREFPSVRLIASDKNLGYAAGNNLAFSEANGDFLLALNPDTEFVDASLDVALGVLRSLPDIGCLGVKQVGVGGEVQRSVRGFPTLLGIVGNVTGVDRFFPRGALGSYRLRSFDYDIEQPAPQPMGTFLMFREEALRSVGDPKKPFDEEFPIFFNEVDLLYRLHAAGWRCLYTPRARILHHGGESTKQVRKSMIWESHRSLVRYLRKHRQAKASALALPFVAALVYLAAVVRARGYDRGFKA